MTPRLRRALAVSLLLTAAVGWAIAINLAIGSAPIVSEGDDGPGNAVSLFTRTRIEVLQQGSGWERLSPLVSDRAAEAVAAQAAAVPGKMPELRLTGGPDSVLLWTDGGAAMVETSYTTNLEGSVTELHMLWISDGGWRIGAFWRVLPEPAAPLVPAVPTPTPTP